MPDPEVIFSGLTHERTVEGHLIKINIFRLDTETEWTLEAVDENGPSTVWDDSFATEQAALDEALDAIDKEGLSAVSDTGNVIKFPTR